MPKSSDVRERPKGYVGLRHETIGSDLLAVVRILKLPEQVFGPEEARHLLSVDPNGWYPIEQLLGAMEVLEARVGHYGLVRMGRALFELSHKARVMEKAKSARDIIFGIDGMYHEANRGELIGGWRVLSFEPGHAELEKTTPHPCVMEQGILSAALAAIGCPGIVSQRKCFRQGDPACVYTISSTFTDERWDHLQGAAHPPSTPPAARLRTSRRGA